MRLAGCDRELAGPALRRLRIRGGSQASRSLAHLRNPIRLDGRENEAAIKISRGLICIHNRPQSCAEFYEVLAVDYGSVVLKFVAVLSVFEGALGIFPSVECSQNRCCEGVLCGV